jgi:hypothetical protein
MEWANWVHARVRPIDEMQETEGNTSPASIQHGSIRSFIDLSTQLSLGRAGLMESHVREIRTYGSGRVESG